MPALPSVVEGLLTAVADPDSRVQLAAMSVLGDICVNHPNLGLLTCTTFVLVQPALYPLRGCLRQCPQAQPTHRQLVLDLICQVIQVVQDSSPTDMALTFILDYRERIAMSTWIAPQRFF